jgi:hypothetical protein
MSSGRRVIGLQEARSCKRPPWIPHGRPRLLAKKLGIIYENRVAKALPGAIHGQWFEFWDLNGHGFCQVDFLMLPKGGNLTVFECKLTDCLEAEQQLEGLYLPVVAKATGMKARGAVIAKNLTIQSNRVTQSLKEALDFASFGPPFPVLHWIGRTALS